MKKRIIDFIKDENGLSAINYAVLSGLGFGIWLVFKFGSIPDAFRFLMALIA